MTRLFAAAALAALALPAAVHAQGTSIAGLLATGYELKAVVAPSCAAGSECGREILYFEGRPAPASPRLIYRCDVTPTRASAVATCVQVR
jgi:hypothetical protein